MPPLRMVSINTGKGDGAYRRRIELLASGLSALNPDLVLIQESLKSHDGTLDTTQSLADRLALHASYVPARFKSRDVEGTWIETWSGMGLLSRAAPNEVLPVALPQDERDGDRIALVARFDGFAIANVHLTHLRDRPELRRQQMDALLTCDELRDCTNLLVGGDFNTRLQDVSALIDGIADWATLDAFGEGTALRATFPVHGPLSEGYCLDYIFGLTRAGASAPVFSDSRVILDEPDVDGNYPSDHRGIMTTVTFTNDRELAQ